MPMASALPLGAADRKLRYQQVQDLVLNIMAERGLQPGDRLPSTTELAEIADVSSISRAPGARRTRAGRQDPRQQGLGTFVAEPRIASDPTRPGELLHTLIDEGGGSARGDHVADHRRRRPAEHDDRHRARRRRRANRCGRSGAGAASASSATRFSNAPCCR